MDVLVLVSLRVSGEESCVSERVLCFSFRFVFLKLQAVESH
jgi:hypothetical protein